MRTVLADIATGLGFFAVLVLTDDIYKATILGTLFGIALAYWIWRSTRKLEPMRLLGLGRLLGMGSATIVWPGSQLPCTWRNETATTLDEVFGLRQRPQLKIRLMLCAHPQVDHGKEWAKKNPA